MELLTQRTMRESRKYRDMSETERRRRRAATRERSMKLFKDMIAAIEATEPEQGDLIGILERWRKARHFRRYEMAALLGIQSGDYSGVINGRLTLPKGAMVRAYMLEIPADEIIKGIKRKS